MTAADSANGRPQAGDLPPLDGVAVRQLSPTDVTQFIRLDQCQRYLRLRLHERAHGRQFLYDFGVTPQTMPELLTRSGNRFERLVGEAVARRFPCHDFAADPQRRRGADDNAEVVRLAQALAPGEVLVLAQPRLAVELGGWQLRGDIDLLRLERDAEGALAVLIADIKSSAAAKVEHRLQVAFYLEMLEQLLRDANVPVARIDLGILYRGPAATAAPPTAVEQAARLAQAEAAERLFGFPEGLLEIVEDQRGYRDAVADLVTGPQSVAERTAAAPFDELFFHLTYKCDECAYNAFCMKASAERDDLSLLPHLAAEEKRALQRCGVQTVQQVAQLKELAAPQPGGPPPELTVPPAQEPLVRQLATTWPVGPRLDELVHRARRYRRLRGDRIPALSYIPSKGYGSLPYCDADHNPNLVRVYLDAQRDYLEDRVYLLGALVVGSEHGEQPPQRRRSIVELTDGPPNSEERERELFVRFAGAVVRAVAAVAAPDAEGERRAPIHLIFHDRFAQQTLLEGLARHLASVLGAIPLYDFVTQLAAYDSPIVSFLDAEIREQKNYPMTCQSLQAVASLLQFDWNAPQPFREIFHARLFDYWSKLDWEPASEQELRWYTGHARFNSQLPLEYAYAAWGELPEPAARAEDAFALYRAATVPLLRGFQARRLEALEHIAKDFPGNRQTLKTSFEIPDLATFKGTAGTLAEALGEFLTIERHAALAAWKAARLAPPERRVLAGDTVIAEYHEADQEPGVAAQNRENLRRSQLAERLRQASPDGTLTKAQREETRWSAEGLRVRLRLSCAGVDCGLDEALALATLRESDTVVVMPRLTVDSRPGAEGTPFTPTVKQLLHGPRAKLDRLVVERDAEGRANAATVELVLQGGRRGDARGFVFGSRPRPFEPGARYTLDVDPNAWYEQQCAEVVAGLCAGEHNAFYARLLDPAAAEAAWPPEAAVGQRRFLEGLDALQRAGALHPFEESKRAYIGGHGDDAILLVQGPPGTGKSYATAFAVFARLQGAMAADRDFRVFASCKTHAATDVLLQNVAHVRDLLRELAQREPAIFATYVDRRLLDVPLYRLDRPAPADGIVEIKRKEALQKGEPKAADAITAARWCVVGATPAATRRLLKERWNTLFGKALCDCLVLDEASQMNLPEAIMAALALRDDAQLIVVGDHRQMPPIVQHDWAREARRTFQQFRSYESLFQTLLPLGLPLVQFEESFRLHADMAEFLRREVYVQDGIPYFSRRHQTLPQHDCPDPFIAAVLRPEQTIVVVLHDEEQSMVRNAFEERLIAGILETLAAPPYALGPEHGLGVVVPHRAQRAALQQDVPQLCVLDPVTGRTLRSAVDTVERFQGDEREAIVVGATESDPQYLLLSSEFLLDPRRLTVALSRAKHKLILVAARSVFALFATDEETFTNAQLWKNLLRRTCTQPLWQGERDGRSVEVWGNGPLA